MATHPLSFDNCLYTNSSCENQLKHSEAWACESVCVCVCVCVLVCVCAGLEMF